MSKLHAVETLPLVNDSAVILLENVLEMVRSGEVESVAIAIVRRDGYTRGEWSSVENLGTLLGAITCMGHKLAKRMAGEDK